MRRIRLVVAYDGTNYSGWQIQKNATTIESELAGALRNLLGEEVPLTGASRTDAGVHALGNIAVFDTDSKIRRQICHCTESLFAGRHPCAVFR